jgi:phosphoribosylanthranilate isomerase
MLANRPVINAIDGVSDIDLATLAADGPIALMLDPSRGRGKVAERAPAAALAAEIPLWLAGGLAPDTVAATIAAVRPWLVDVSTGVETDGAKDPAKIAAFVRAAKGEQVG